jgi:hypothetical protein
VKNLIEAGDKFKQLHFVNVHGVRNVFLSRPTSVNKQQARFYLKLERTLQNKGLKIRCLGTKDFSNQAPLLAVKRIMSECQGAIILGLKQIHVHDAILKEGTPKELQISDIFFPTPWNNIEAGMSFALGIPMLIICEDGVEGGIFDRGISDRYIHHVNISSVNWLESPQFMQPFNEWYEEVVSSKKII